MGFDSETAVVRVSVCIGLLDATVSSAETAEPTEKPIGKWTRGESWGPVLFCSLAVLDPRVGHTTDAISPFIPVILIDSSMGSPVHVLMLSIQAVRGLPRLRAPNLNHTLTR